MRIPVRTGALSRDLASIIVALRWVFVLGWAAAALAAWIYLPGTSQLPSSGAYALVPTQTSAFAAIQRSEQLFRIPLLPQIAAVERNPDGLDAAAQQHIVRTAVLADEGKLPGLPRSTLAAPLVNTVRVLPALHENSTTAITYLGFRGSPPSGRQLVLARRYAHAASVPGAPARLTGLIPGALEESKAISGSLHWVEIATVLMVLLVVSLYFRAALAPLVVLAGAAILYALTSRCITWLGRDVGISFHQEVEPIVVVLLLGVVTDYSVFMLSGFRDRLRAGEERLEAARNTTAQYLPIIFTAGLIVAFGLSTLEVASIGFVRSLGPGMGIVVATTLLVSLTLVPSLMAILGRALLWPGVQTPAPAAAAKGHVVRSRLASTLARRPVALLVALVVSGGLAGAATLVGHMKVTMTIVSGLASSDPVHAAAIDASRGFAAGIVAPTEVVVQGPGIARQRASLAALGGEIERTPGVAAAIGAGLPGVPPRYDVFRARNGDAARYLIVFDDPPFSSDAVHALERVQAGMPGDLKRASLPGAKVLYAGDTPVARDSFHLIYHDLALVGVAVFLVNLVLLMLFLRSVVAPLYLVCASMLSLGATVGVTVYVFQDLLHYGALTYYVPLAVGVLLVAFGSDYNLFVVGRIWQEAQARSTREAVAAAVPRASRAISVAGLVLALSFAMLAIVPLRSFREVGFAVAFGVLLDTFVVRTLLLPSLVTLAGRFSWWPGRRFS